MSEDLRKLAAALREAAKANTQSKRQKCASLTVAAIGLEELRRKIYGES